MGKNTENKRRLCRELYIKGLTHAEIALRWGVTERTIRNYAARDKDLGQDWDVLRVESRLSDEDVQACNRSFLASLFKCFEQDLPKLEEIAEPAKRIELLERYVNSYHRLQTAAKRAEPAVEIADVAAQVLDELANLATAASRSDVAAFLLENLDTLRAKVRKRFQL